MIGSRKARPSLVVGAMAVVGPAFAAPAKAQTAETTQTEQAMAR